MFFQDIICFLILGTDYGAGDTNILTVRMISYDKIFDLFEFFIKGAFIFTWRIIRPNMNNDVVGLFFRFVIKRNIRFCFCARKKSHLYLLVAWEFRFPQTCYRWISCYERGTFSPSSHCLGGLISDGFDCDVLFLASSVCMYGDTGWGITISLFSSVAILYSSLSMLLSTSVFCLNLSFFKTVFLFLCYHF